MNASHFRPECPDCQSRLKHLPPTRGGKHHVFCADCGHDFGRYETLVARYRHELDALETRLGLSPTADDGAVQTPRP